MKVTISLLVCLQESMTSLCVNRIYAGFGLISGLMLGLGDGLDLKTLNGYSSVRLE
jgi:hypothetical protein